jgi:DNA-directed RNA polymerase subunit K/omega
MKSKKQSKIIEESIDEPVDEELEEADEIDEPVDEITLQTEDLQTEDVQMEDVQMEDVHTEDIVENDDNCIEIDEPQFLKDDTMIPVVDPEHRTSKNKMTRYEFVRVKGERIMQLSKGAKPLIKKNKQSEELTYKEIAVEEIRTNMVPFKIKRFVKDHYEIWGIDELDKKHLEPLFH